MAWHSKKNTLQYIKDKVYLLKKQSHIKETEKRIISRVNTYRRFYLHLYKRLLFSYNNPVEELDTSLSNTLYVTSKRLIKEFNDESTRTDVSYTRKQRKYIVWVCKMVKKYTYEHNFKNAFIMFILKKRFNGHDELVTTIYSYL
jgi:vacuolar-type H+-ATPase subunit E/Vma4